MVAKNGDLLLNIGPRPTARSPRRSARCWRAIGDWLAGHGEAIYGSEPWVVFGEGPTAPAAGSFTDAAAAVYTAEDIRFTTMTEVGAPLRLRDRHGPAGGRPDADPQLRLGEPVRRPSHRGRARAGLPRPARMDRGPTSTSRSCSPPPRPAGRAGAVVRIELAPEAAETRIDFFHGLNI